MKMESFFLQYTLGRTGTVTITDTRTDRKYKAGGGGYCKKGSALGDWLEKNYQDRLTA